MLSHFQRFVGRNSDLTTTQRHLALVRFLGYIGAQFNFLLVPLLVYRLSGDAVVAGGLLLLEWLPKVGVYLVGGSVLQRLGERHMHIGLETARTLSFAGLAACAWLGAPLWVLGLSAGLYQCSNAISNVVFERAVTRHWSAGQRAQGQAMLLQQDQLGCLLALALAWAWTWPEALTLCALGLQAAVAMLVALWSSDLHAQATAERAPQETRTSLRTQLKRDFGALQAPVLRQLMAFAALSLVCNAVMLSGLAFLLEHARAGVDQPAWRASLLLGKTLLALVILTGVRRALQAGVDAWTLARLGLLLAAGTMLALALEPSAEVVWLLVLTATGCSSFVPPWLRATRQKLVEAHVASESRNGVTGILSAAEPVGYVVGGLLLSTCGTHISLLCCAAAACALLAYALGANLSSKVSSCDGAPASKG